MLQHCFSFIFPYSNMFFIFAKNIRIWIAKYCTETLDNWTAKYLIIFSYLHNRATTIREKLNTEGDVLSGCNILIEGWECHRVFSWMLLLHFLKTFVHINSAAILLEHWVGRFNVTSCHIATNHTISIHTRHTRKRNVGTLYTQLQCNLANCLTNN